MIHERRHFQTRGWVEGEGISLQEASAIEVLIMMVP